MPVNVQWDNTEKTIIRVDNEGIWSWSEFHEGLKTVVEMLKSVDHRVDIINYDKPGSIMPKGSPMPHFQTASRLTGRDTGLNITVITNTMTRIITTAFTQWSGLATPDNFRVVASLEEAYSVIAADRKAKASKQ